MSATSDPSASPRRPTHVPRLRMRPVALNLRNRELHFRLVEDTIAEYERQGITYNRATIAGEAWTIIERREAAKTRTRALLRFLQRDASPRPTVARKPKVATPKVMPRHDRTRQCTGRDRRDRRPGRRTCQRTLTGSSNSAEPGEPAPPSDGHADERRSS